MKSIAIMQPYFFPYLGHFKLIEAADIFLSYGYVFFRKKFWITRNRFRRADGETAFLISVPVSDQSSYRSIRETKLNDFPVWLSKFLATLRHCYHRAPHRATTLALIEHILTPTFTNIAALNAHSLRGIAQALEITTPIIESDDRFLPLERQLAATISESPSSARSLRAARLTQHFGCEQYLSPISGQCLYDPSIFAAHHVQFQAIQTDLPTIQDPTLSIRTDLSIIDILMNHGIEGTQNLLREYPVHTS